MFTDPSYLRSIRDGILSGTIEVNNSNALPEGLAGVFDRELFPSTLTLRERRELLLFFAPFALAQKEISVDFAADVLAKTWMKDPSEGEANYQAVYDQVNRFIQLHSKRFVSAGEGKYRLYHERFRIYILQKVTELDIRTFNDQIISLCEKALEEKSGNEKEIYALEFLSTHLYINAMQDKEQGAKLKSLAYDQTYWERQNHSSKSFEWSKKMLNEMMAWASKFDDDEVIECALQKVDLYHQEQNDAPRIVQLVVDGEIETALERIEKFGDIDEEGQQRKFILYMLCLFKLILLDSKDKDPARVSIEKILNHFEGHINRFGIYGMNKISDVLILKLSYELKKYGLNLPKKIILEEFISSTIYNLNFENIKSIESEILDGLIWIISNYEDEKIQEERFFDLVKKLIENNKFEWINELKINLNRFERLIIDVQEIKYLISKKETKNAKHQFEKIKVNSKIRIKDNKCRILSLEKDLVYGYLSGISKIFGDNELYNKSKNEFYKKILEIDNQRVKDELLFFIVIFFMDSNLHKESDKIIELIKTEELLIQIYSIKSSIHRENLNYGQYIITIEKINSLINVIEDEFTRDQCQYRFVEQLFCQSKFSEGFLEIKRIKNKDLKNKILMLGALKKVKSDNKTGPGLSTFLREINDDYFKYETIKSVNEYWVKQGLFELSVKLIDYIKVEDSKFKDEILYKIDFQKYIKGLQEEFVIIKYNSSFFEDIQADLICNLKYNIVEKFIIDNLKFNTESHYDLLKYVVNTYSKTGLFDKSIFIIEKYEEELFKNSDFSDSKFYELFGIFCNKANFQIAVNYVKNWVFNRKVACKRLLFISEVLQFNNCNAESLEVLKTCFETAKKEIYNKFYKGEILIEMLSPFFNNNLLFEYYDCKQLILNIAEEEKGITSSMLYAGLIQELILLGNEVEAKTLEVKIAPYDIASLKDIEKVKNLMPLKKESQFNLLFENIPNKTIVKLSQDLIESNKFSFLNYIRLNKILDFIFKTEVNIDLISFIEILSGNNGNTFEKYFNFAFNKAIDEKITIKYLIEIFKIKNKNELHYMLGNYYPSSLMNPKTLLQNIKILSIDNASYDLIIKQIEIYGLYYIFFNNDIKEEKMELLTRILNLQWAIDIKNQLPS
jgi:hypothetical protein